MQREKNFGALHRKPYQYITPQNALRDFSFSRVITINYSFTSLYSSPLGKLGEATMHNRANDINLLPPEISIINH